ncbi:hypothetical protein EJ05DRAFT_504275 [Pseudovirgaria hyperparasitica]|uniref:Uncharacterized protein n=1 Tax=Pseudovirgaria hyperparasitica TaxID=470096 RepID=A0A6A6VUC1_9PEZI|nr:uncharacterized protein EJ05DRAFT_504275 [Pseudovirgaria hyperparasitica]KAF2754172.1 hypothetical protein EJ05DRAFT_504275 [Pseudovirgaria hyperparasitica]
MTTECPLPEVEVALAPYIRTRQEALLVRQRLTAYLQSHVRHTSDLDLTSLSLGAPAATLEVRNIPVELSGLRRQYLEALEANAAVRQRRDELQDELRELRIEHSEESSYVTRNKEIKESMSAYTTLLRQRRKLSRLQILQAGIEELVENAPELAHKDLKSLVEDLIGASPDPPSLTLEAETQDPLVEELTFKLKKELLIARRKLEEAKAAKQKQEDQLKSNGTISLQAELTALRVARDELVEWIEGELSKIGEESELQNFNSPTKLARGTDQMKPDAYHQRIQGFYNTYLDRRKEFVAVVDTATTEFTKQRHTQPSQKPRQSTLPLNNNSESSGTKVSELISTIPALVAASRTENDLQQQLAHLRRQITSSTEETLRSLRRLADESHLVPPRSDVNVWIHAAGDSKRETENAVERELIEGEKSMEQAKQILRALRGRRENFLKIKGAV